MTHSPASRRSLLLGISIIAIGCVLGAAWMKQQSSSVVHAEKRLPSTFLKIDALQGPSIQPNHVGEFEVPSLAWIRKENGKNPSTELSVSLSSTKHSPLLFQKIASGQSSYKTMVLSTIQGDGSTTVWTLTDVKIESYELTGDVEHPFVIDHLTLKTTKPVSVKTIEAPTPEPEIELPVAPTSGPMIQIDLANVVVQTAAPTILLNGQSAPLDAIAHYSDASQKFVTNECVWTVSDPLVGYVTGAKFYALSKIGITNVTCTYTEKGITQAGAIQFTVQLDPGLQGGGGGPVQNQTRN